MQLYISNLNASTTNLCKDQQQICYTKNIPREKTKIVWTYVMFVWNSFAFTNKMYLVMKHEDNCKIFFC